MYLLGPSFTNIAHLLGPFLGEKTGRCLTGKKSEAERNKEQAPKLHLPPPSPGVKSWQYGDSQ